MKTVVRKVVTGKCERCDRVMLLDLVKDQSGRQILLCERCITAAGVEGLPDPFKRIQWIK